MGSSGIQAYTAYTACFWAWEGSFVQNNEKQFQGIGGWDGKRGNLLQVLRFFAVFVRGGLTSAPLQMKIHIWRGEKEAQGSSVNYFL